MRYKTIIRQAKLLYLAGYSEDKRECAERAITKLVSADEMCQLANTFDITLNDLVEDVYQRMQGDDNEDNK